MASIRGEKIRQNRVIQRNQLFPNSEDRIWTLDRKGYTPVPRILPLLSHIFGTKEQGNPTRVYFELWCRAYEVGFAEIRSEEEAAYSAGYTGQRAVRTWRSHLTRLKKMGFVEIAPRGNVQNGFVLLIDPFKAIANLKKQGQITEYWFNAFHARCLEIGTKMPDKLLTPKPSATPSVGIKKKPSLKNR